jgi:DNA-binding GntR family transcriptional regulator
MRTASNAHRPLYLQVAEELSRAIQEGRHPVGSFLPTESSLCARFGVSRFTVRQALHKLREAGLVSPEHGIGTRIERAAVAERFLLSLGSVSDMARFTQSTRHQILRKELIEASEASIPLPRVEGDGRWLLIELLRFDERHQIPMSLSQIHVHPRYTGVAHRIGKHPPAVFALIEEQYGEKITTVRQEITAVTVPRGMAEHLQVKPSTPTLRILRHYLNAAHTPIEISQSIAVSERFVYSMDISTQS